MCFLRSYERGCQAKTLLHSSPWNLDRCLHPGPFFFVERILVLTPGAQQSSTGIRMAVAGLHLSGSCSGADTIRCEAAQANRWLKCQPSSYVRLEAYGFFGLSEGA